MKIRIVFACVFCCMVTTLTAQDGKIIEKTPFILEKSMVQWLASRDSSLANDIAKVEFHRIVYLSDGLKVTGYMAEPKAKGNYPCIISNRGGNRDFGAWDTISIAYFLGRMATWNYVVVATQYRGVDGGEGMEEFGGKDLHDVLNLIPVLSQCANADTSRIGIEGASRGGMMTYLALKESSRFKAAVVTSGMADAFKTIESRPDMETEVYAQLIPEYTTKKEEALKARSAVHWAEKMCKTTPLLIMHGSSDWRVQAGEAIELVEKLHACKHPVRFILYEGADHSIREFKQENFAETKRHFDHYLRDEKPMPNMNPHGK